MKIKIIVLLTLIGVISMILPVNGISAGLNQTTPAFTSEPTDTKISVNDTLNLKWDISNSDESNYEFYMTKNQINTTG